MVATDDEVSSSVVLSNDGVPDGLSWPTHTHSKTQQAQHSHSIRIARHQRLIHSHTSEVVNVTRFCKTDNRVNEDVSLS